jgi:hypothetical protein
MTEIELLNLCGTLTKAASRIKIFGRFEKDYFVWFDPAVGARWKSSPAQDKKDILVNACKALQEYLTPWNPPQST